MNAVVSCSLTVWLIAVTAVCEIRLDIRYSSPCERIDSGDTPLVLLCPAWRKYGTAKTIRANTTILHSRADDVVPFADSEELLRNSGLPESALIEVGNDHRLADPEPLKVMLEACERGRR